MLTIFFLTAGGFASAAAIKVTPAEIKLDVNSGKIIKKEITVENPDLNVELYEVYADNFSDWIKIKPASFTLESEASKKVTLEIKNNQEGIYTTNISVVAKPLSGKDFKAASGVKIPVEIKVSKRQNSMLFASIQEIFKEGLIYILPGLILLIISIFVLLKRNPKRFKITSGIILFLAVILFFGCKGTSFFKKTERLVDISGLQKSSESDQKSEKAEFLNDPSNSDIQKTQGALLVINFGENKIEKSVEFSAGMTAFDILKGGAANLGIPLKTKIYDIGVFVEAIGDKEGGQDGKYWMYYVNGQFAQIAADRNKIKAGDRVEWKFEASNF